MIQLTNYIIEINITNHIIKTNITNYIIEKDVTNYIIDTANFSGVEMSRWSVVHKCNLATLA